MRFIVLIAALVVSGCGDADRILSGPSAVVPPLPAMTADGQWSGGLSLTIQNQRVSAPVTLRLTQSGNAVDGWWSAVALAEGRLVVGQDVGGDIRGSVSGSSFSGTVTWDSERFGGGRCSGQAGISGTLARGQLVLQASSIPLVNCSTPTALQWNVVPGRF